MDLYNKLKGVDLGSQSDDYFRGLGFSRGRQDAIDYMAKMRDQDPAIQAQKSAEAQRIAAERQKQEMADRFAANKAELGEFTTRFGSAVPAILDETSEKYNVGGLLGQANALGTRVSDLRGNLTGQGAGGVASASQVDRAINTKYLPRYQQATENLGRAATLASGEAQTRLTPYLSEASLLNDRIAREATGYSQADQRELDSLVSAMNAGIALSAQQMQQIQTLAEMEQRKYEFEKTLEANKAGSTEGSFQTIGGRVKLINPITGAVIADLGSSSSGAGSLANSGW